MFAQDMPLLPLASLENAIPSSWNAPQPPMHSWLEDSRSAEDSDRMQKPDPRSSRMFALC